MNTITYQDFEKVELRVGKIIGKEEMMGRLVVCVVNFPPKQIGPFVSEVLTCGASDGKGNIALLSFDRSGIPLGSKIF